ncbi:hypothetical protein ACROYT_G011209 [Oculina patagonica]
MKKSPLVQFLKDGIWKTYFHINVMAKDNEKVDKYKDSITSSTVRKTTTAIKRPSQQPCELNINESEDDEASLNKTMMS